MSSRVRNAVAPGYLFACLILGGSAQGIWQNTLLQLVGVLIIFWAAIRIKDHQLAGTARQLLVLAMAVIALVALQTIPLPSVLWEQLGPRARLGSGFTLLGLSIPREPLSLTPSETLNSLLRIVPPLAMFCSIVALKAYRPRLLILALIVGMLAGVALGALQVASTNGAALSEWYLYPDTNGGRAVGFFANADHMATLLVVAIPFLAAIASEAKDFTLQRSSAVLALAAGVGIITLIGIALNGSLAGYALAMPVTAASLLLLFPKVSHRAWILGVTVALMIAAVAALELTPVGAGKFGAHASSSVQSRAQLASTTWRAARDFMPFGSGLGSFQSVYPLYEAPEQVTDVYVVHAHDDYLEVALEFGLFGVLAILAFLSWWSAALWRVWRSGGSSPFARAATIASAAILAHSVADFPLRTSAIAASFAMCMALLSESGTERPTEEKALREARNIQID